MEFFGRQCIGVGEQIAVCFEQHLVFTLDVPARYFDELASGQAPVNLIVVPVFPAVFGHPDGRKLLSQIFGQRCLAG